MKKRRRNIIILFIVLALFAALLADSNLSMTVSEYEFSSAALPRSFEGFTVVQISDLHGKSFGKDNSRLLEAVEAARPDIIAVTGDLVDRFFENTANIEPLLEALTDIAPVYYVSGNHEWGSGLIDELAEIFDRCGVTYLSNGSATLERGGESIVLAGVEDPNAWADMPTPPEVLAEAPEGFRMLLGHRNYWYERYPGLDADIVLCGHAHGGIVRLPIVGGVLGTGFEFFPDYTEGLHTEGSYALLISRGLGNSAGIPRLLNKPELVVLKLSAQ